MGNYVKTSELNLSKKLIKERREDINRWCDGLKSSFNRILDEMEKGGSVQTWLFPKNRVPKGAMGVGR